MMQSKMKIIGITGGIGSGKSTVAHLLSEEYGIPIIDADELVRVVSDRADVVSLIQKTFGHECVTQKCQINRTELARIVFDNETKRKQLNAIIHPLVREEFNRLKDVYASKGEKFVIYDCPLMIEEKLQRDADVVVLIYADMQTRIDRIMKRSGMTHEQATARIDAQMDLDDKIPYADIVVYNNASKEQLKDSLKYLFQEINTYERSE